jgi:hypothetical protein
MKRKNFPERRSIRRDEAYVRQTYYDNLTHDEKVASAKASPGNSKRQLVRLNAYEGD